MILMVLRCLRNYRDRRSRMRAFLLLVLGKETERRMFRIEQLFGGVEEMAC